MGRFPLNILVMLENNEGFRDGSYLVLTFFAIKILQLLKKMKIQYVFDYIIWIYMGNHTKIADVA